MRTIITESIVREWSISQIELTPNMLILMIHTRILFALNKWMIDEFAALEEPNKCLT